MVSQCKIALTVQVATKAPQLNRKEIAFNGVNQDLPAIALAQASFRIPELAWRAGSYSISSSCLKLKS
jgi:hypothetical protein